MSSRPYRRQLKAAIRRTHEWGLESFQSVLLETLLESTSAPVPRLYRQREIADWTEQLSRSFSMPPEQRTNSCIEVHVKLAIDLMLAGFPFLPVLTIGAVGWKGDECFDVTERSLKRALDTVPEPGIGIDMHVWLTFPDGTILDFSLPSWQCKYNREPMNLMEPGGLRIFECPDQIRNDLDYRPLLVGPAYLIQTASANEIEVAALLSLEQRWLELMSER